MKRFISAAIAVLMLFTMFIPATVSAAGSAVVSLSGTTVSPGDTFTATISLQGTPSAKSFNVRVSYDSSVLELIGANWVITGATLANIRSSDLSGVMAFENETNLNRSLINYTFRVKSGAKRGTTTVTGSVIVKNPDTAVGSSSRQVTILCSHVFDQKVVADKYKASEATCQKKATYYYSCECGEKGTKTFEAGSFADHKFDRKVVADKYKASDADCTHKATYYYSCVCGAKGTKTFESGSVKHTFNKQVATEKYKATSATCQKKATYYYSCECGAKGTKTFEYGDFADHKFNKKVTSDKYKATDATCQKKATYYYSCECGAKGTKTFEGGKLAEHKYNQKVATEKYKATDATCQKKATYYYSCECGAKGTKTFEYGELSGHKFNKKVATEKYKATDATCTEKATYYYSCVCGAKGESTFKAGGLKPHDYGKWTKVDEIFHQRVCSCGDVDKQKHTWDNGKVTKEATAKTTGEKHYTCTACGAKKTAVIPISGAKKINPPKVDSKKYTYTGSEIEYTVPESNYYTVSGNKQTNAGEHTVVISLKDKANTCWADGSTDDLAYSFVIRKAEYDTSKLVFEDVVAIENGEGYSMSVKNVPAGVTVTYSGNDVEKPGTYVVTASFKGDDNYKKIKDMTATLTVLAKPEASVTLESDRGTVEGYIPNDAVLVIDYYDDVNSEEVKAAGEAVVENNSVKNEALLGIYDVYLVYNNVRIELNGEMKLSLKLPEAFNGKTFEIYQVSSDKDSKALTEKVKFEKGEDNTVSMTVSKLSQFVFAEGEAVPASSNMMLYIIIAVLLVCAVAVIVIVVVRKKKKKNS